MANTNRYGFLNLRDVSGVLVSTVGASRVADAIRQDAATYTRMTNELLSEWAVRVTVAQELVSTPGSGTLQPIDADGNPLPVKPGPAVTAGYPIFGGATAWGTNRVSRALMTVAKAERATIDAFKRDNDWITRHLLASVLTVGGFTFNDRTPSAGSPNGIGNVVVLPLANSDTQVYSRSGGTVATDNHYLAQAAAIADASNPYPIIRAELAEHPGNTGRIVAYISTSLVATTQALTNFIEPRMGDVTYGNAQTLANFSLGDGYGFGTVVGVVDGVLVVEAPILPAGYIIAKVEGQPIVGMREYPAAELQGFFPEFNDIDGNHLEARMIRFAGFGVFNRTGALAYQIGAANYSNPAAFTAPLGV